MTHSGYSQLNSRFWCGLPLIIEDYRYNELEVSCIKCLEYALSRDYIDGINFVNGLIKTKEYLKKLKKEEKFNKDIKKVLK